MKSHSRFFIYFTDRRKTRFELFYKKKKEKYSTPPDNPVLFKGFEKRSNLKERLHKQ